MWTQGKLGSGLFCCDDMGAAARCWKEPDHDDEHGYGGEDGSLRWFLHNAPDDDPRRPEAERLWRQLKHLPEDHS